MVTINVNNVDATLDAVEIEGTLSLSGAYPAGGDTVNFSVVPQIPSNSNPIGLVEVDEQPASGATPSGYILYLIAGSTPANWLLWIATVVGQPPTQLGAGNYPASLAAATLQFRAKFFFGV